MTSSPVIDRAAPKPLTIRVQFFGRVRSAAITRHAAARFERALDRFRSQVASLLVRVRDINGSRGGVDQQCSLELQLVDGQRMHFDALDERPEPAINRLARRARSLLSRRDRSKRHRRRR
ncbi:MAG: hypothetical protein ACE37K_17350 [Planctomycetota bacterium]|jgi:hypothetical protein